MSDVNRNVNCDGDCPRGCDGDHGMSLSAENRWLWGTTDRLEKDLSAARATIARLERERSLALRRLARFRAVAAVRIPE